MKAKILPYLLFDNECEEAFNFYKSIFGNDFTSFIRYSYTPPQDGMPTVYDDEKKKILHIELPITDEVTLAGGDIGNTWGFNQLAPHNTNMLIKVNTKKEADQLFKALSQGGTVLQEISKTFWAGYFGVCKDKFGITWMINEDFTAIQK